MAKNLSAMVRGLFGKAQMSDAKNPGEGGAVAPQKDVPASEVVHIQIDGCPAFAMRHVPPTPAKGFQRDGTARNVSVITRAYWMGETPVTKELFESVMGEASQTDDPLETMLVKEARFSKGHKSFFCSAVGGEAETPAKLPVEQVSWYDVIVFCNKLSLKARKTPAYSIKENSTELDWANLSYPDIPIKTREEMGGNSIPGTKLDTAWRSVTLVPGADGYRLPTEMEWMWAAMGATKGGSDVTTAGCNKEYAGSTEGSGAKNRALYAWYDGNSDNKTHQVGLKKPNELGLFDMSGNINEWCWDLYAEDYPEGKLIDYTGANSGSDRVQRGGGWGGYDYHCKVSDRDYSSPTKRVNYLGLRLVSML